MLSCAQPSLVLPQGQGSETPDMSFLQPVPKGLQLLLKEEQCYSQT